MTVEKGNALDFHGILLEPDNPEDLFVVVKVLGRGTFGHVYQARNRKTEEMVAIKQIPLMNDDEIDTIRREVKILQECIHDNIVHYRGTYRTISALWIAMEFCAGGSVDSIFKIMKRPLSEKLIAYVCREVLKGLIYLHSRHKIHRDIKGGNILLTSKGEVKLADFGVSTELVHTMSRRNSFIGTLCWMAPEAIQEQNYDERADLWSLGITLIEMAESAPPYVGLGHVQALFAIPKGPPPNLQNKDMWSPLMQKFLARVLVKDPLLRPSAAVMLADPFVSVERIGKPEDLAAVVEEAIERAQHMSTARRLGENSTASSATFVRRRSNENSDNSTDEHVAQQPASQDEVTPFHSPSTFLLDGTVVQLPLITTEDISFDELCPGTCTSPLALIPPCTTLLADESYAEGAQVPVVLLSATQALLGCYHYHRHVVYQNGLTAEDVERSKMLEQRYGSALKTVLRI